MSLPIRAFWLMNSNVGRLLAEKDLRQMAVQDGRNGGEAAENIRKHLVIELGEVGKVAQSDNVMTAERDEEGFAELKALADMM